jgi:hypothetical protein
MGSDVGHAISWYCSTYKGENATTKCSFLTTRLAWPYPQETLSFRYQPSHRAITWPGFTPAEPEIVRHSGETDSKALPFLVKAAQDGRRD